MKWHLATDAWKPACGVSIPGAKLTERVDAVNCERCPMTLVFEREAKREAIRENYREAVTKSLTVKIVAIEREIND